MPNRSIIQTPDAPAAIGTYSQAIRVGETVYLSGQIGLDPSTMQMMDGIEQQIHRVFQNLRAVSTAATIFIAVGATPRSFSSRRNDASACAICSGDSTRDTTTPLSPGQTQASKSRSSNCASISTKT